MTVVFAVVVLFILVSSLAAMYLDVCDACHEAIVESLWEEDE